MKPGHSIRCLLLICLFPCLLSGCQPGESADNPSGKTLRIPMPTNGPKSLDPVQGSTHYENIAASQVYETLLQYKYLKRPFELEPLLLAEMPTVSEEGLVYHFKLKQGVYFHDDACFPDGKGREVKASDVIYSWKRMADQTYNPKSWWLYEKTIVGFDEYREEQIERVEGGHSFEYDKPVEGLEILGDYEFKVKLIEPVTSFIWKLAMFQTAVVPHEAVDTYGIRFARHTVGTGPFTLNEEDWHQPGNDLLQEPQLSCRHLSNRAHA
ncbi:MAG: ABC transporter substrate-binding protein [Planctomycetaceae bacterium]